MDVDEGRLQQRLRALVAALRSGTYTQTTKALARVIARDEVHYCCLGVACEVAIADGLELPKSPNVRGTVFYGAEGDLSDNVLPDAVELWYGFNDENPYLEIPDEILGDIDYEFGPDHDGESLYAAAELNDEYGLTLAQLADCFEYTFLPQDWEVTRDARG